MHEVSDMENGYFALFMQTGAPEFYLAARGARAAGSGE